MGLKDKLKGAWNRVTDLDDESAAAKDQASAGDRIPYKEISKKLKELMKKNVDVVGRKILIPPFYTIYFSEYDRQGRLEVEDVLCDELREELYPEMRKINPDQNKREIQVSIATDNELARGAFRIDFSMKRPSETKKTAQEEKQAAKAPEMPADADLKATIIEQAPDFSNDDQATIIQTPVVSPQFKLIIDSGDNKTEFEITKDKVSIGRATQDDVVLESDDFSISRGHAVLEYKDGQFTLLPVGVNGTFLNEQELELQNEVVVSPADEIRIVNYRIRISE